MCEAKSGAEIAPTPLACKKHMTAYGAEIEGLGRTSFLGYGLNLKNQKIRPYHLHTF